ncbi:glutamate 5-kinase [Velocimicrobium porci]|uniref:Glutamate 5-kinase n=1 Tax=Velocimicrobium porci TaxID=2606634 RepID=A0A6L5XZ73_9FIRM|nr:glutamate 5-kinase [Velocimicrobium porci]MSS64014.1 glutamate 5-kinase [Velocimicrobium porci]
MNEREYMKEKKRIVVKLGTSTLTHEETGTLDLLKMEQLIRILTDLNNQGKEVVVVSSGAIGVGRKAMGIKERPKELSVRQACAAIGQAKLMMVYQKLFAEYSQLTAQVLMTKYTMLDDISRRNAENTFRELLQMGVIPIVNENDTVSTDEIEFGDNDTLSAIVAALIGADLLILMSDIDGLYTDDPHTNKDAKFIHVVEKITESLEHMGKDTNGSLGTGGMATKISAAKIAVNSGADMVISNGKDIYNIAKVVNGESVGTLFKAHKLEDFDLTDYIKTNR